MYQNHETIINSTKKLRVDQNFCSRPLNMGMKMSLAVLNFTRAERGQIIIIHNYIYNNKDG